MVGVSLFFKTNLPKPFFRVTAPFYTHPLVVYESFSFSTSLPKRVFFFDSGHSIGFVVVYQHGFNSSETEL